MKALIAMSGGVDSSVAAHLIKQAGYDCLGVIMRLTPSSSSDQYDFHKQDAEAVCGRLGIPFEAVDLTDKFRETIINGFINSYLEGKTPNPCIECNKIMKFGKLLDHADINGADKIATGHYARVSFNESTGRWELYKAKDPLKDQSYVLYTLTQDRLKRVLFPLGDLTKQEVRDIAVSNGFINAGKSESQDICFIPDGDYASFISCNTEKPILPGNFVTDEGVILGMHKGITHYTIGQRKGLGISSDAPLFVTGIRPDTNEVVLSHGEGLFKNKVTVSDVNLISVAAIDSPVRANVKLRYRHKEQPAVITPLSQDRYEIVFDEPQRAPTPGQSAVFYDADMVIGGGVIE